MTMGHFATALVPHAQLKYAPLWLLLCCAQLPDLVWLALALLGVEAPHPASALDVTMVGLHVDMLYSHSGAGIAALALATGALVLLVFRDLRLSAACAALVVGHWLCDLLSGWEHEALLAGSPRIGFDLYAHNPYLAFAIEAVFAGLLVLLYASRRARRDQPLSRGALTRMLSVFVGGSLAFAPSSYVSLRALLGL